MAGSERGILGLYFTQSERWRFSPATDAIALPEPKPRAIGQLFIVPAVRCRHIAVGQGAAVGHREDALKLLDLGNCLFRLHPLQSSSTGLPKVKRELRGPVTAGVPAQSTDSVSSLRTAPNNQHSLIVCLFPKGQCNLTNIGRQFIKILIC